MRCEGCRWWTRTISTLGKCSRYPPSGSSREVDGANVFPTTESTDYCGEFQAKVDDKIDIAAEIVAPARMLKLCRDVGPHPCPEPATEAKLAREAMRDERPLPWRITNAMIWWTGLAMILLTWASWIVVLTQPQAPP